VGKGAGAEVTLLSGAWFESRPGQTIATDVFTFFLSASEENPRLYFDYATTAYFQNLPIHQSYIIYHQTLHRLATDSVVRQPTKITKCNMFAPPLPPKRKVSPPCRGGGSLTL
jgi:hypothetical protein